MMRLSKPLLLAALVLARAASAVHAQSTRADRVHAGGADSTRRDTLPTMPPIRFWGSAGLGTGTTSGLASTWALWVNGGPVSVGIRGSEVGILDSQSRSDHAWLVGYTRARPRSMFLAAVGPSHARWFHSCVDCGVTVLAEHRGVAYHVEYSALRPASGLGVAMFGVAGASTIRYTGLALIVQIGRMRL